MLSSVNLLEHYPCRLANIECELPPRRRNQNAAEESEYQLPHCPALPDDNSSPVDCQALQVPGMLLFYLCLCSLLLSSHTRVVGSSRILVGVVVAATAVVLLHAIGDSLLYLTKCFTLTVCGLIFTAIGDEVRIFLDHGGFKYHGEVFYAVSTKLVELYQRPGKIIHLFILKDFAEISGKYISSHANSIEHYWEERLYKLSECLSYFGLET